MKIVFFGTPDYVIPVLEYLHKSFKSRSGEFPIVACVTQKPKLTGRKKILTYSPVDKWAHNHKIKVLHELEDVLVNLNLHLMEAEETLMSSDYLERLPKS